MDNLAQSLCGSTHKKSIPVSAVKGSPRNQPQMVPFQPSKKLGGFNGSTLQKGQIWVKMVGKTLFPLDCARK
jgi:hypothetical protein